MDMKQEAVNTDGAHGGNADEIKHDLAWCVDNQTLNLQTITEMLKRMGLEVHSFTDPSEAVKAFKTADRLPDIIFTDLWMDKMNGDKFTAAIKKLPRGPAVPIIAVTVDEKPEATFCLDCFDMIINKPISFTKLKKALY